MTFVIGNFSEFKSVKSASIITRCVLSRKMRSSQRVAVNHKPIPQRTVNHCPGYLFPGTRRSVFVLIIIFRLCKTLHIFLLSYVYDGP